MYNYVKQNSNALLGLHMFTAFFSTITFVSALKPVSYHTPQLSLLLDCGYFFSLHQNKKIYVDDSTNLHLTVPFYT